MTRHSCGTHHEQAECPYCKLLEDSRTENLEISKRNAARCQDVDEAFAIIFTVLAFIGLVILFVIVWEAVT